MRLRSITVRFPYVATYIPERRRKPVAKVCGATAEAKLQCVDVEDVRIAFLITYPKRNAWIFLHPRKQLQETTSRYVRSQSTIALIEYAGAIWWPLALDGQFCYPGPLATDAECVEWLSSGSAFWYREAPYDRVFRSLITSAPGPSKDAHDAALSDVRHQVGHNLLLCGDKWYRRGGVPVFLKRPYRSGKVWEIDVADPGPDRDIGTAGAFTASHRDALWNNEAFRSNFVWSPAQHEAASRSTHRLQSLIPHIEILLPEFVTDCREAIRIDALYTRALEMFEYPHSQKWDDKAAVDNHVYLTEEATVAGNDAEVTARRVRALTALFAENPLDHDHAGLAELRMNFRSFVEDCTSSQLTLAGTPDRGRMTLAWEDQEAMRSLADPVCR